MGEAEITVGLGLYQFKLVAELVKNQWLIKS